MPPKSSNKKGVINWFHCEKCKTNITTKDREGHEKLCPIDPERATALSFIKDGVLFTTTLETKQKSDETSEIPEKFLNNLIFLSEGVMRLCGLAIGEYVQISLVQRPDIPPQVRLAWPIPEKFLTTVFISDEDFNNNWESFKGLQLKIENLKCNPIAAEEIMLELLSEENLTVEEAEELENILLIQVKSFVFTKDSEISCNFYNKKLRFKLADISMDTSLPEVSIVQELESLNISEKGKGHKFFKVGKRTSLKLQHLKQRSQIIKPIKHKKITTADIGGLEDVIRTIKDVMNVCLGQQWVSAEMKVSRGLLIHGPTGCGKSMVCEAIANETLAHVIKISASEIFSKYLGETEMKLKKYFDIALNNYPQPSLIIIEDVNNISPKIDNNDLIKRVSASFVNLLDELHSKPEARNVFLLATTSNIESVSLAVRRCGRLDNELEISVPNANARAEILVKHLANIEHTLDSKEILELAKITHGFVGSDLANLIFKGALHALQKHDKLVCLSDINKALSQVRPSAMREVLIQNPNVKWEDIGGHDQLKLKLKQAIEWPLLHPDKFRRLGIKPPRGILMYGPPGCSKTMIAKALATESRVNFLSIKGPELFSMWVGESERAVREVFRKARQVSPSIIFFDEIDAIGGERSFESGSSVKERVLAQILTELDGVSTLNNVTIVAATNRPDMIDKALLRPGRIDRIVYVGLPDRKIRMEIFRIKMQKMPLAEDVILDEMVDKTEGYSGAEIQAICHEAALKALEEDFDLDKISKRHFEFALNLIQPRTDPDLLKLYADFCKKTS